VAFAAGADEYPSKSVRVIVSYAPGGATDIVARLVAQKLSENMGRGFIVENRPGASGVTGDTFVARAAPDGYTLLGTSSTFAINPAVIPNLPFDSVKDFAPVTMTAQAPFLVVVHPSLPVKTVKDLIALAKAKPGVLNFASAGPATAVHLAMELFNSMAGVKMTAITYKGTGEAMNDLIAGRVHLTMGGIVSMRPLVTAGKLRALAVSSAKRSSIMPQTLTVVESGVPEYVVNSWYGWLAPAGTPAPIVNHLYAEIAKTVKQLTERLVSGGADPVASPPEQFGQHLVTEIARWRKVVKETGIKSE